MGKKAKTAGGIAKASQRKVDKSQLPPPPPEIDNMVGSSKPVEKPAVAGDAEGYRVLGESTYDDGGVADLSLLIDLDDHVQRRRRGETEFFSAAKANLLPRATTGPLARYDRRDQKVHLAQILFSEADGADTPSEVYIDQVDGHEDQATVKLRRDLFASARGALQLSQILREPACASLSLTEICKRRLLLFGKPGAPDALRCADKALQIAGDGFYDNDDIALEIAEEVPVADKKHEEDPTIPGLANPAMLKYLPLRVSQLCVRSAALQRGNALAALGRDDEARESYESVYPLLENEPRCARVDWERHTVNVNIGNTYCRQGDFENAYPKFAIAEQLGQDHLDEPAGSEIDGLGMVIIAKRARAFALQKEGKEEEAKELLKEVITLQMRKNKLTEEKKKKEEEKEAKEKEEKEKALAEAAKSGEKASLVVD